MKFGFSKLLGIVLGLILIGGCSANKQSADDKRPAKSSQTLSSQSNSRHIQVAKKASRRKTNSQGVELKHKILAAEKQCIKSSAGKTSVFVDSLNNGQLIVTNNQVQRSASVIKLFIMIDTFHQIQTGRLKLNQLVSFPKSDRVDSTGELANQAVHQVSVSELLKLMIRNSDNSATNVLIDHLGGLNIVNEEIRRLNCNHTKLQRKMLDYQALQSGKDNLTTSKDIGKILVRLYHHHVLRNPYDSAMLQLLRHNANQSKLPALINQKSVIYNKTGEFPQYGVQNDAAIIKKGNQAFIVVVLSENGVQTKQINAMQQLGENLYTIIFH
ncbi:serine hydrolase [Lentilactobacillus diolivorans]|uniref:Beta-lactamase class A n=2 Tax=Lentilactobacillus diolivorans TaxID=179838 RepID=A0A0R1SAW5_9LACO|nr:serine hydrolase [Lentilactobacillus diolivorans]KRL66092.1 beta-lactamase class A [Lentilactobacillus diolivorans DSM 14421]GEP24784.1 hypothetical protein LDI01_23770 [Lentilactobacillus diolivorans]